MKKIILASASTRRKEILENLNLKFDIVKSDVCEKIDKFLSYEENVERIALDKALDVAGRTKDNVVIIAADTMVVNEALIGKPSSEQEAFCILRNLSGKVHQVITGVCVFSTEENRGIISHRKTKVKFAQLDDEMIWRYIKTGEMWDKAGAYAIQGLGSILVESIEGCYTNIVGLPTTLLREMLVEFDINIL
ncbi:septum formation protein Maf [Alkalibaculum sp. M08DMB]|uniref:dTTP/UTP pyrophosphatase n=1 Tax=Alkalibaculum sporogenes TaxID=2655001 RepID=A0A6A7K5Z2_9FIRM|nr:Maf family protein [Alkalibaculum sporogenes]MPW24840.1 septum formation protein Maf [Alkalibaculum sporogenes]